MTRAENRRQQKLANKAAKNSKAGQQPNIQQSLALAVAHHQAGRLAEAEGLYRQIMEAAPDQPFAAYMLGVMAHEAGNDESAAELLSKALAIKPDLIEAHNALALALRALGRPDDARACCQKALALRPDYVGALNTLGLVLHDLGRLAEAAETFNKGLAINPDFADSHSNLGLVFQDLGKPDEAVAHHLKALAIKPDYAEAHNNHGNTLREMNQLDAAVEAFDRTIALRPDHAEAYWNKALALLLGGDFANGWDLYEWRWKRKEFSVKARLFAQPLWLGKESLGGKSILLNSEQGLGDTIQFCRYAKLVSDLGARVILEVERPLVGLLKKLDGVAAIVAKDSTLPPFDYHCPLLSLPLAFKTGLDSIPNAAPYLHAEAPRARRWADKIGRGGFKIGICWQGGTSKIDIGRSFPVTAFREISKLPDVRLISLHKGDGLAQLDNLPSDMTVEGLGEDFDAGRDAFLDTAAVMTLCDLIITSDTAVAHLAGALEVPTWVALRQVPDWRWQLAGTDSPWYPSMKLFRQPNAGDWQNVFAEMAGAIHDERRSA
jgi:tetratricopeptide (TPR) repeat protein